MPSTDPSIASLSERRLYRSTPLSPGPNASNIEDMPDNTREEFYAKLEAVEARTDTKFTELVGKLETLVTAINGRFENVNEKLATLGKDVSSARADVASARSENLQTRWWIIGTVVASALAVIAIVIASLS